MRISDWSSDVCSSDLLPGLCRVPFDLQLAHQTCGRSMLGVTHENLAYQYRLPFVDDQLAILDVIAQVRHAAHPSPLGLAGGNLVADAQIGSASCRGRVGQYVSISGCAVSLKTTNNNRE